MATIKRLPREKFPFTIEALHPGSSEVVWSTTVQGPSEGELTEVNIPPLRQMLGHPVTIRITFADGEVIGDNGRGFTPGVF